MLHIDSFMEYFPLGCIRILFPDLFDVYQRVLPLAEENMLEGGDLN